MPLRPYSTNPRRLALQIVVDVLVLVWIIVWTRVGVAVHDAVLSAASVGYRVQGSAAQLADNFTQAGQNTSGLPLVGDALSTPLRSAATQVGSLATSGQDLGDRLTSWATLAGWLVALGPVLVVLAFWLPARLRFARRAAISTELATAYAGEELLALRALTNRPLPELRRVAEDPLGAFRSADPDAVHALAGLELAAAGVPPRRAKPATGPPPLTPA
jgi:hypothetical protein